MYGEETSADCYACEAKELVAECVCFWSQYFIESLNNEEDARKEREPVNCKFCEFGIEKLTDRHKTREQKYR